MTHADIRTRLIQSLAKAKRRSPEELEAQLLAAGPECPFDSIYLVRVGVRVGRDMGIKIQPSTKIARHFKSIDGLADLLHRLDSDQEAA